MTTHPSPVAPTDEELRRLALKATPGPWSTEKPTRTPDGWPQGLIVAATARGQGVHANPPGGSFPEADRRFIAAANPARVLALLDELAKMREALRPFADFADVMEPGECHGKPWHSSVSVCDEADEMQAGLPDDTPIISAGSGWPKIPASYVTGLTLGDFRRAARAHLPQARAEEEGR